LVFFPTWIADRFWLKNKYINQNVLYNLSCFTAISWLVTKENPKKIIIWIKQTAHSSKEKSSRTKKTAPRIRVLTEALRMLLFAHITPFSPNTISVICRQERTARVYFILRCACNYRTERKISQLQAEKCMFS
jgi:hypothetical protein